MSACAEFKPVMVQVEPNSEAWLVERKKHCGSSDAAIILGMSKWGSVSEIQGEKLGLFQREQNEAMERGHLLEPLIRRAYAEKFALDVFPGAMFTHPDHPWMAATTDGSVEDSEGREYLIEIKTVNDRAFKSGEWGADGTDEVPEYYLIQVMHQLAVTGLQSCYLVALAAPSETLALLAGMAKSGADPRMLVEAVKSIGLHTFRINRNEALIADMIEAEGAWWQRHIVDKQPAVEVAKLKDNGSILTATEEQNAAIAGLREARGLRDEAEEAVEKWEIALKKAIGEASGIKGSDGQITWKKAKDSVVTVTDWEAVAVGMAEETKLAELFNALVKDATKEVVKPGSRRFVCPRSWSKKSEE